LSALQDDKLTADNFLQMLSYFIRYLSVSSHESMTNSNIFYKKLDVGEIIETENYITKTRDFQGIQFPFELTTVKTIKNIDEIDYSKPYIEVIKEMSNKSFTYKEELIIPKVVRHHTTQVTRKSITKTYIKLEDFLPSIEKKQINNLKNEIDSKERNLIKDMLYKLSDSQQRVDGGIYI
jgi:hypothetical protein